MAQVVSVQVDKRPSGSFRVRLRVDDARFYLATVPTRAEAQAIGDAARVRVESGEWKPTNGNTVATYGERVLDELELGGRRGMKSLRYSFGKHIKTAPFAGEQLAAVTRADVKAWRAKLIKKLAPSSVGVIVGFLHQIFEEAVDDELVEVNPVQAKSKTVRRRERAGVDTRQSWNVLSLEEQDLLRTSPLLREEDRLPLLFLLGTGMRVGEATALRLADVDVDGEAPHVVVRYGSPPAGPTKSNKVRVIALFGIGLEAARQWLQLLPGYVKKNPHGLMFPSPQAGSFRDRSDFLGATRARSRWRTYRDKLFGRPVRLHDLRHTCATSLVNGWWGDQVPWPLDKVRDQLGHGSVKITERYAHASLRALMDRAKTMTPSSVPLSPSETAVASIFSGKVGGRRTSDESEAAQGPEGRSAPAAGSS